ncbi:MAG: hypothetical protein M1296_05095 [Chloroflexi bacterium]|nr:hypothetical protein [Chloroflexota bacterium]
MTTWTERIRAALAGDVASADVAALFGVTKPLDDLHQQLGDARLSAEITHGGGNWQVTVQTGPIAAPLWLADQLVALAQSLCEAEAEYHQGQPTMLSAASHALAVAVLEPLETIIAEVSAALIDPHRPSRLNLPWTVGPDGDIAHLPLPVPTPPGYLRGLLLAVERIQSATGMLLTDVKTLGHDAATPSWLIATVQRLEGELAAASARRAMLDARLSPLLSGHSPALPSSATTSSVSLDLWSVLNTALVSGQQLADPRLLPGAPSSAFSSTDGAAARPGTVAVTTVPPSEVATPPAAPPGPPSTPPPLRRGSPASQPGTEAPPEQVRDLPDIQAELAPQRSAHRRPDRAEDDASPLPDIGEGPIKAKHEEPLVRELPQIGPDS